MSFYNKYLKYKNKYIALKNQSKILKNQTGGFFDRTKVIDEANIIRTLVLPPLIFNSTEIDFGLGTIAPLTKTPNYIWTYDLSKTYIKTPLPDAKSYPYYLNRLNSRAYKAPPDNFTRNFPQLYKFNEITTHSDDPTHHSFRVKNPDSLIPIEIRDQHVIITKTQTIIEPYDYNFMIWLFSRDQQRINAFNNIFSTTIQYNIIDELIILWAIKYIPPHLKYVRINRSDSSFPQFTIGQSSEFDANLAIIKTEIGQIYMKTTTPLDESHNAAVKIHLSVKLEKLFWAYETIIKNLELFKFSDPIYGDIYSFSTFKINTVFYHHSILEDFLDEFPSNDTNTYAAGPQVTFIAPSELTYTINSDTTEPKKVYNKEQQHQPIFVFYLNIINKSKYDEHIKLNKIKIQINKLNDFLNNTNHLKNRLIYLFVF